jgi:hypothetical protein
MWGRRQSRRRPGGIPEIEGDNFVLGDAIEIAIGTKARPASIFSRWESCRFRADLLSVAMGDCFWVLGLARWAKATILLSHLLQITTCSASDL